VHLLLLTKVRGPRQDTGIETLRSILPTWERESGNFTWGHFKSKSKLETPFEIKVIVFKVLVQIGGKDKLGDLIQVCRPDKLENLIQAFGPTKLEKSMWIDGPKKLRNLMQIGGLNEEVHNLLPIKNKRWVA
jgi:hypothetical protein